MLKITDVTVTIITVNIIAIAAQGIRSDADALFAKQKNENAFVPEENETDRQNDFKAVREGEVWTTDKSVFQASNITSQFTMDIYEILHDKDESKLQFLKRVH